MKNIFAIALLLASGFMSSSAFAYFDARLSYGFLGTTAGLSTICSACAAIAPSIVPTYGLGADAIVTLPIDYMPGIGIRYENMGLSVGSGGDDYKLNFTRTALLLNWHLIDTLVYVGPILTYGISHSTSLKVTENGTEKVHFTAGSTSSYSAGLEAGVKLIGFTLGAEVGYMYFKWKDCSDSTGNSSTQDINMSGTYGKLVLGFSI